MMERDKELTNLHVQYCDAMHEHGCILSELQQLKDSLRLDESKLSGDKVGATPQGENIEDNAITEKRIIATDSTLAIADQSDKYLYGTEANEDGRELINAIRRFFVDEQQAMLDLQQTNHRLKHQLLLQSKSVTTSHVHVQCVPSTTSSATQNSASYSPQQDLILQELATQTDESYRQISSTPTQSSSQPSLPGTASEQLPHNNTSVAAKPAETVRHTVEQKATNSSNSILEAQKLNESWPAYAQSPATNHVAFTFSSKPTPTLPSGTSSATRDETFAAIDDSLRKSTTPRESSVTTKSDRFALDSSSGTASVTSKKIEFDAVTANDEKDESASDPEILKIDGEGESVNGMSSSDQPCELRTKVGSPMKPRRCPSSRSRQRKHAVNSRKGHKRSPHAMMQSAKKNNNDDTINLGNNLGTQEETEVCGEAEGDWRTANNALNNNVKMVHENHKTSTRSGPDLLEQRAPFSDITINR